MKVTENRQIQIAIVEIMEKENKLPKTMYFATKKGESCVFKTLKETAEFLGYKHETLQHYNHFKKFQISKGVRYYPFSPKEYLSGIKGLLRRV